MSERGYGFIINASANNIPLADKSIHAVVCSPPYFGLRKYEGAQDVDWPAGVYAPMTGCPPCVEVPAMRVSLGNEPTIEAFIWHLLLVMREVRRVLRDDGVCWVNLGDSYSGSGKGGNPENSPFQKQATNFGSLIAPTKLESEITGGNLLAIPHRFALAAQADDWTLRNDCVWAKKSATPESVTGWRFQDSQLRRGSWRHTRAQEYVFMFTKGMGYWSDSEIVKEANSEDMQRRASHGHTRGANGKVDASRQDADTLRGVAAMEIQSSGRNPRSVFSPSPSPYKGAHYATFPKELIRPLILSSVPRRCCPECGQGWAAVVEGEKGRSKDCPKTMDAHLARGGTGIPVGTVGRSGSGRVDGFSVTTGYRPTCDCGRSDYVPGIVLDPFVGSGTTLEVARECGVRAIGLDISHEYLEQQASWRGLQIAKPKFDEMPLFACLQ